MLSTILAEGLPREERPKPCTIVVYGASGDLASRKLYPALFTLFREGHLDEFHLVGFARRSWGNEGFREVLRTALEESQPGSGGPIDEFLEHCFYAEGEFDEDRGYEALKRELPEHHDLVHYRATAPEQFTVIAGKLLHHQLSSRSRLAKGRTRVVIEKPFGRSGREADSLNRAFQEAFEEEAIYRIDHYLGKESAQNIQVFRFGNRIFEPVWNNQHIKQVEITVAETVGVESRGPYYEKSGALLDMIQNHLLQLLALVAMECPARLTADAVRDEKVKVFRSLRPLESEDMETHTLRAQYTAGRVDSQPVRAYRDEERVDHESPTETWAGLVAYIDNWRWAGVPFLLRTGKRLSRRLSEIVIHFKEPPVSFFSSGQRVGNQLVFRIQSEEGITLFLDTKVPGLDRQTRSVSMDFLYGTGAARPSAEAYEKLILDALLADGTLYTRSDEVAASWAYIDPIKKAWNEGRVPLAFYPAGSAGPKEARELAGRHAANWRRL